ncbi:hypothetical protein, partial [Streptomyces capuensis]|uniref:hypothetical protein n=1 Tax=Streptomyces capuensis TaxID=1464056 RepID=UPI000518326A
YQVAPGALFTLGENGRLTHVDTSSALAELRSHVHDLKDRAANTARLPAVALGTLDPSKVPSGYALQLSLGPLDSLISGMRLARDHKDALLLKFVQRLYRAGQHPDWAGLPVLPTKLVRGPYTPTDKAAVLEQVALGVEKGVLSLETAVRMLSEAGFPIDDVAEEIDRIQARQFDKAKALADATGDTTAVGDFLGIDLTPGATPPTPQLPPTPGQQDPTGTGGDPATSDNSPQRTSGGNTR